MNKNLVNSDEEFVALFKPLFDDYGAEKVEDLIGCKFAFEDGTFQWDENWKFNEDVDETQDVDFSNYRKDEDNGFPEKYPCVVCWTVESDQIAFGSKVDTEVIVFVYLSDFGLGC